MLVGIGLAGLLIGGLAGLIALRYYPAYRSALAGREELQRAQALLRERRFDATESDLALAATRLDGAERDFHKTRGALDDPLVGIGRRLPLLGASLEATVQLTDIGLEGVSLGRDAIAFARTYAELREEDGSSLTERTPEILAAFDPRIASIKQRVAGIRELRQEVTGAALPPSLVSAVREIDRDVAEIDELTETYDDLAAFLPDFLGFNEQRTYLVLAQNNAELLPTGGLISVYGLISLRDGRITERRFEDAVSFSGRWLERSDAYIEPPPPLKQYLLKDVSWNLAVANWSPHFPAAARDAERFFRLAGGPPVDGVIAINGHTIEGLLRVTGPIDVDPYDVTVTAENALEVIEERTRSGSEPGGDRKAFVGALAEALLPRLTGVEPERWSALLDALQRLRDERQLLIFAEDKVTQAKVQRLGLDGALESGDGDYAMLVDASVNSTKLNMVLDQRVDLRVRLDRQGDAHHELAVSYENRLPAWSQGRDPLLVRRLMLGGLYGGYLRLLAPAASELQRVAIGGRAVGPGEISREQDKAVFGRFFALASGDGANVSFDYRSPGVVVPEDGWLVYRLYLQKQSGTEAIPVSLRVSLPPGAVVKDARLDGEPVDSTEHIETDLARDRALAVRYRFTN